MPEMADISLLLDVIASPVALYILPAVYVPILPR